MIRILLTDDKIATGVVELPQFDTTQGGDNFHNINSAYHMPGFRYQTVFTGHFDNAPTFSHIECDLTNIPDGHPANRTMGDCEMDYADFINGLGIYMESVREHDIGYKVDNFRMESVSVQYL